MLHREMERRSVAAAGLRFPWILPLRRTDTLAKWTYPADHHLAAQLVLAAGLWLP